ncbi:YibE/F family protein [Corynebacterium heidelbergense]|uniref:YibE/F family protein n=1 Tax=Corynebacterium heidelbergense TaxID=2055947 RepID=A0A364VC36_9CORY|nr:YibE/F family protein [Corynebacterium heidelbergense]RAV34213.1 YibE/F family protein [Corynebacterium heidelbergense]WCZ35820.1 YibE/F-like protein [Corynebacterium heidelbergense]
MGRHAAVPAKEPKEPRSGWSLAQRLLALGLLIGAIATAVGLVAQWPDKSQQPAISDAFRSTSSLTGELADGTVALENKGVCNSPSIGQIFTTAPVENAFAPKDCQHIIVDLTSGPDSGKRTLLEMHNVPGEPNLQVGDKIRLSVTGHTYAFQDYQRNMSLWLWLGATVVLLIVVGAWRGARSIVGLAVTMAVILLFLLPALARGGSPVMLAVTCGAAVLYLVLFLVHGVGWKTAAALGGTLLALGLAAVLSHFAITTTHLRGLGNEANLQVLVYLPQLNITGLLLAGMIVGSLGVLNDVTIAQASTVSELHELEPAAGPWRLFAGAMRVGRDHIASMMYTLVLSYTGVALPTLLLLSLSGRPIEQILTSDVMATEILRSATGALGLVAAVPLTTAIAAVTVRSRQGNPVPAEIVEKHRRG